MKAYKLICDFILQWQEFLNRSSLEYQYFYPVLVLIMHMCCYNSVYSLQDYENCYEVSHTILVLVYPGPG